MLWKQWLGELLHYKMAADVIVDKTFNNQRQLISQSCQWLAILALMHTNYIT
jgi:hypothetical protein